MKVAKLQLATRTLLNPGAAQWDRVPTEQLPLGAPPLHVQPSSYVRTTWAGRSLGAVRSLSVQAAHNGRDILFRLKWRDETENTDHGDGSAFPDAAGVIFPQNGDAPLLSMGSPKAPVEVWYWRANFEDGSAQTITAKGLGTAEVGKDEVQARAKWADGSWQVVLSRALAAKGVGSASLASGSATKVAFAVWEGASQERGGLKSFSKDWRELAIG
jgi:complex iron-sulfur molybdoenzyme family reductase subunit gamma